jgi:spore coat protein A
VLGGAGTAAAIGVPLLSGISGGSSTGGVLASRRPMPRPFTRPLPIPPALTPTRSDAGGDVYDLVQRPGIAEILPGVRTTIWGYNGVFPGPTIRARRGRPLTVVHRNALPVPTVVHLHGGHTPSASDGFPTDLILPVGTPVGTAHRMAMGPADPAAAVTSGSRDYAYPMTQRAATLWYHDHRMGFTGPGVWRGLAGFFLVSDEEEDRLPLPRDERELPLMIADRSFAADGSLAYPSLDPSLQGMPGVTDAYGAGVLGDVIVVNGAAWPYAEVTRARYRLRLLNASNARRYRLALDPPPPGGGGLVQIGTDGGLLAAPLRHDAIEIAPAQRFDVIVDFARYRPGTTVTLVNEFGSGSTRAVLQFRLTGTAPRDDTSIPAKLSTTAPPAAAAASAQAVRTRTFAFRQGDVDGMPGWLINGEPFDPTRALARPRLGATEIWQFSTDFHHPIHLHLTHFQVLSRNLAAPGAYDAGWKDTVDLRPAEVLSIAVRFTDYAGRYVLHCHNLEHEDMAMMATYTVT